ncbi:hypothetical protein EEB14_44335 [Rhodococcus sp. WS4]|nr:hypothetical protein EEB14_44335 [Rhodococcus sp. WS4]
MHSTHTFTTESAAFDERTLMAAAGLVPVLELAEQSGQLIRGRRCERRSSRIVLCQLRVQFVGWSGGDIARMPLSRAGSTVDR